MKKQTIRFLLLMIMMLSMSVVTSFAQSTTAVGTVITGALNVREAPFATANIITTVTQGYTAGVIGKNSNATWYQIILPGGSGWVNGHYLAVTNAHTVPVTYGNSTEPIVAGGFVNTGMLNVRPIPSPYNNTPLTQVALNTGLTIFGRNADSTWYKVVTPTNVQGWVRSTYITVTSGNISALPIVTEDAPATTVYAYGYVNTGALNLRWLPNPFNNIPIRYYYRNTVVEVIGRTADSSWYQVKIGDAIGWMRGSYIAITSGDVHSAPVTY